MRVTLLSWYGDKTLKPVVPARCVMCIRVSEGKPHQLMLRALTAHSFQCFLYRSGILCLNKSTEVKQNVQHPGTNLPAFEAVAWTLLLSSLIWMCRNTNSTTTGTTKTLTMLSQLRTICFEVYQLLDSRRRVSDKLDYLRTD